MAEYDYDIMILNASELVTVHNEACAGPLTGEHMKSLGVIENGALVITGGKITAVGTTRDIKASFDTKAAETVKDASGKCVTPGFVDPHTHLIFAGSREHELPMKQAGATYLEILASGGGILSTVRQTRESSLDELIAAATRRLNRLLAFGTTSAEAKSGYGLDKPTELRSLEAIQALNVTQPIELVPTFLGAHAIPEEYKDAPDDYIDYIIAEVLPEVKSQNLAEYCDIFCEQGVYSVEHSEKLLKAAKNHGLGLRIHSDEIVRLGGTELAISLGAISASHLMHTPDGELLPATPFALMESEYPRARDMIGSGVPVALSTDLNPNCWTESMQFVIALACYQMKMHPSEALAAATLNAAYAINRADKLGSLTENKQADILLLDAKNHLQIPYHFGVNLVDTVIKSGEVVRGGIP
jgi:imidazolonepropionase